MLSARIKPLIPIGLVVLLTAIPWIVWKTYPPEIQFDDRLQKISTAPEIERELNTAESFVRFQASGLLSDINNAPVVADLYFRLGEALLARHDGLYLNRARIHLERSIELYPRLRHGWPYYQLGHVLERMGPPYQNEAKNNYQRVSNHDHGHLALQAGYRIALLDLRTADTIFDPRALYHYIRFSSPDPEKDLQLFERASFDTANGESLYLRARLSHRSGDNEKALELLSRYRQEHPGDWSALFYQNRYRGTQGARLYPMAGDLLASCFAPRSTRGIHFSLFDEGELLTDVYLNPPGNDELAIELSYENPFPMPLHFYLTVNGSTQDRKEPPRSKGKITFRFSAQAERNLVRLYVRMNGDRSTAVETPWIHLISLRASRSEPGNPS